MCSQDFKIQSVDMKVCFLKVCGRIGTGRGRVDTEQRAGARVLVQNFHMEAHRSVFRRSEDLRSLRSERLH